MYIYYYYYYYYYLNFSNFLPFLGPKLLFEMLIKTYLCNFWHPNWPNPITKLYFRSDKYCRFATLDAALWRRLIKNFIALRSRVRSIMWTARARVHTCRSISACEALRYLLVDVKVNSWSKCRPIMSSF